MTGNAQSYGPPPVQGTTPGSYPPPQNVVPQRTKAQTMAWWTLGLGLGGIFLFNLLSYAAVIMGHIYRKDLAEDDYKHRNANLWGIITGYAGIVLGIIGLIATIFFFTIINTTLTELATTPF